MNDDAANELYGLVRTLTAEVATLTALLKRMDEDRSSMEGRLRELEIESAKRKGIMTVVAAIGGVVGSLAVWLIKHLTGGAG